MLLRRSRGAWPFLGAVPRNSPEETAMFPKRLSFDDVIQAVRRGRYHTAGTIGLNLVRNKLNAAQSFRRSKWYLR
jgi:hypothetical protein